jgi:hypothetical protein
VPGARKIELFARNNNLRKGWLSLGNQLGENYVNWKNVVNCDSCRQDITTGHKYYKSKVKANYDLCQKCMNILQDSKVGLTLEDNEEMKDDDIYRRD